MKIGPESGRVTLDLQPCFQEFPIVSPQNRRPTSVLENMSYGWVSFTDTSMSVTKHTQRWRRGCQACSKRFCNGSWWGREQMGRGGRRFSKFTPSSMNTNCRIGCNGRSPFLPKPWLFCVWLSRFTNGMIQNKMSITTPLVTCGGNRGEEPNKSCVTGESKWKDPVSRKRHGLVTKQVSQIACGFSTKGHLTHFPP